MVNIPSLISFFLSMKVKQILGSIGLSLLLMFSIPSFVAVTSAQATTSGFSDVPNTNIYNVAITDLKNRGIIGGYPDGTFKPDQVVNRVEALKIILLGSAVNVPDANGAAGFSDTPANQWYAKYLIKARGLGIVSGYPNGTFKPSQTVNLVENLKMLVNTMKVDLSTVTVDKDSFADTPKDQWYAKFVEYAKEMRWISSDSNNMVYPAQGMTRGKLAQLIYNAIHSLPTPTNPQPTQQQTQQPGQQPAQPIFNTTDDMMVNIQASAFVKDSMTIPTGTKVLWTNKDSITHTVTSDDGLFDQALQPGQSFEYTFSTNGTFNYHCKIHPMMTGSIIVKPAIEVPTI